MRWPSKQTGIDPTAAAALPQADKQQGGGAKGAIGGAATERLPGMQEQELLSEPTKLLASSASRKRAGSRKAALVAGK